MNDDPLERIRALFGYWDESPDSDEAIQWLVAEVDARRDEAARWRRRALEARRIFRNCRDGGNEEHSIEMLLNLIDELFDSTAEDTAL